jgi:ribonuclease P/MRP protein subunit RPP1
LATNVYRKGVINQNELNTFKEFDLIAMYKNYSIKFVNAKEANFVEWDRIKLLSRVTIEISESKEIFQFSNPNNALKSYDIIAIAPRTEQMFDVACGDVNVDIISINYDEKVNFALKKSSILSAIDRNMFFEITFNEFIKDDNKRGIFISNVMLLLDVTKGKNVIISSGSSSFYYHRSPYDIITIFETIFDMKKDDVQKLISDNCEKVVLKSIQRKYFKTVIALDDGNKTK